MLVVADDEDGEALTIETAMGELRDHVMANDQLTHPICFSAIFVI